MGDKDLPIAYGCAFRANSEPQAEESGLLSGSSACFGALPSDRPPRDRGTCRDAAAAFLQLH